MSATPSDTLVAYHDNCPDGFTAAWAANELLFLAGVEAEFYPLLRGQEFDLERFRGKEILFVDLCLPRRQMDAIADVALSISILDHHDTSEREMEGWNRGRTTVFDSKRSGAGITWDELSRGAGLTRPTLVDYVEDRDLWKWKLPQSREISELVFATPRTFEEWSKLADLIDTDEGKAKAIELGTILLKAKKVRVKSICASVVWVRMGPSGELVVPVVNTAWDFSEIGEELNAQYPTAPMCGYWWDRSDGKRQWGFRNVQPNPVHCGKVCQAYGGGGHAGAAGFQSEWGWMPPLVD